MRALSLIVAAAMACNGKPSSTTQQPPETSRFARQPQPKVSPVCERARESFGYGAECLETELTDLETAAGKVWRLVRKGDVTASWTYVLVKPDGSMYVGDGGKGGFILGEITSALDVVAIPPEKLARLHAALVTEAAVVRCLPGTNDSLPNDRNGQPIACTPPAIAKNGDRLELTYLIEKFPHPRLARREAHTVSRERIEVQPHLLWAYEGTDLLDLPRDTPLPPPPLPVPAMTTPPAWVAEPVAAAADVSAAICAAARNHFPVFEGQRCQAYAYPALDLPTGSLYYVANDAGLGHAHAVKKPDGTFVVDYHFNSEDNPLLPIIKSYDPATVPPAKLMAAYLFLHGKAARILCLPGSGDVIPGHECTPPSAVKKEDKLVLSAILELLPFPDLNGMTDDPAVRSMVYELSPSGKMRSQGVRLIDLRE